MPLWHKDKKKNKDKGAAEAASSMAGDLEIRGYRRNTKDSRKRKERAAFEAKMTELASGYTSKHTLANYNLGQILGTGSFGRVVLAQEIKNGRVVPDDFYAIKCISKERVIKTKQVEHTINEKNILYTIDCRFIVNMVDYYLDTQTIYFVLEFVNGGEMFTHIQKQRKRRFTEEQTRFFAAETVLAFEYMHNLDIIFRDLKPENMLIDYRGHIKVTDFGFAKRVDDKTWTMCGTPEYLAPEIIVNKGYGHAVDWWAIGILTYEMRCGRSPFEARSQMEMFKRITKRDFKFPRDFTPDEQSYIGGLLQVDLTRRLGNMHGGVGDIRKHPYFKAINWDQLLAGTCSSPFVPKVKGPGDCSNFDSYPDETFRWHGQGPDKFGDTFTQF